jgi:hypothetical protein
MTIIIIITPSNLSAGVSEDPRPYYPTTDYSSEERSWSDISTTIP